MNPNNSKMNTVFTETPKRLSDKAIKCQCEKNPSATKHSASCPKIVKCAECHCMTNGLEPFQHFYICSKVPKCWKCKERVDGGNQCLCQIKKQSSKTGEPIFSIVNKKMINANPLDIEFEWQPEWDKDLDEDLEKLVQEVWEEQQLEW